MTKTVSEMQLDFKDVLIKPAKSSLSSRSQVHLARTYHFLHSPQAYHGVPVIVANMDKTGTMSVARVLAAHECMTALHKHYNEAQLVEFFGSVKNKKDKATELELLAKNHHPIQHSFYSMGIVEHDFKKFKSVVKQVGVYNEKKPENGGVRAVCIDVANGYMEAFVEYIAKMRKLYPELIIMAGNVVCPEMTRELFGAGADIVKVGIGSGSVCQTRVVAGVGRPQLSAIMDSQNAVDFGSLIGANRGSGHIVSDGGITCVADFSKALAVGIFGVMAGGIFSGHDECETPIVEKEGQKFLEFYGMSSAEAMEKYSGGVATYRASEGKKVYIPYKGSVNKTIQEILGGIRSAHTYVGAHNLEEFKDKAQFYRVSQEVNEIYGKSK